MRHPVILLAIGSLPLIGCPPDYLDLGNDYQAISTGSTTTTTITPFCVPGATQECYTGPEGTKWKGICVPGETTCNADGTAFGPCEGEILPMPAEDCATMEDDNCDGQTSDCVGLHVWSRTFGDSFAQVAESIATDGADNIAIAGMFYGSIDFGGGTLTCAAGGIVQGADAFVAKFDSAGNHVFSRRFGDGFSQDARGVAMDSLGDIAAVGWFLGEIDLGGGALPAADDFPDIFVTKLDGADGTHIWSRSLGADPGVPDCYAITFDPGGNVVVTGAFTSSIDLGAGPVAAKGGSDLFVAKFDGVTGAHLWSKTFGGVSDQAGCAATVDEAGHIVIAGTFTDSIDLGGDPLLSVGGSDIFVVKLSETGDHVWSKALGATWNDSAYAVTTDALGNIVVGGTQQPAADDNDVFVALLDSTGTEVWSKVLGDSLSQQARSIDVDQSGNIVVGGTFHGALDFGNGNQIKNFGGADLFLAKLTLSGDCLWVRRFGDDKQDDQLAVSVAMDGGGNTCITGSFVGAMDVGPTILMSEGLYDVLLMKLSP